MQRPNHKLNLSLREITSQNFNECINLKVAKGQEKFVAPNSKSIAQAKIYLTVNPFAVYDEDEMVGFVMFGFDADDKRFYLVRLMIDEKSSGQRLRQSRDSGSYRTNETNRRLPRDLFKFCSRKHGCGKNSIKASASSEQARSAKVK